MKNKGFTLIEMLVAIAIFSVVSVAALGALLVMTASSQKVQATRTVVDNISFVVEDIVRESRLAVNHWCGNGLLGSGGFNSWENSDGDDIDLVTPGECTDGTYFAFNKLKEGEPNGVVWYRLNDIDPENVVVEKGEGKSPSVWQSLSLDNIEVLNLSFSTAAALTNGQIPLITIHLEATVDAGKPEETDYNIQTSVHPRFPKYANPTP